MTTLAWPTLSRLPSAQTWTLIANTQVHVSPISGVAQTQRLGGALWATTITYANVLEADAALLQALLVSLEGKAGRVNVPCFGQRRPRGTISGSPLVKGAVLAGATQISIDNVTPGQTLLANDLIGIGGRIYMCKSAVTADGSGTMAVTVGPATRAAIADNAAVTLIGPTTKMMLVDDRQSWEFAPGRVRTLTLDLIEALP
jgi:hypothetical protein